MTFDDPISDIGSQYILELLVGQLGITSQNLFVYLRCTPLGHGVVDAVTNARHHEGEGIGTSLGGDVRQCSQGRVGIGQGWKPSGQHRSGRFDLLETAPNQTHALRSSGGGEDVHGSHIEMRVLLIGNFGLVRNNIGEVDDAGQVANILCTTKQSH